MRFAVSKAWSGAGAGTAGGRARVGALYSGRSPEPIETPALLLATRKGLPCFIAPDLIPSLPSPDSRLLHVSPLHFYETPSSRTIASAGGLHGMVGLEDHVFVAAARDSVESLPQCDGTNKFGASFETPTGRRMVKPSAYMELIGSLKPNMCASLADEVPAWVTEKRNKTSVDRTVRWLDECLASDQAQGATILGAVVGGSSIEERKRCATEVAMRNVPAPRTKGTKVMVCCSLDSLQSSRIWLSHKYSCEDEQPSLHRELDQILKDAKSFSDRTVPKASNVPFLHVNSSEVLMEAKKLDLIGESTFSSILLLQQEESRNFSTRTEVGSDHKSRREMKIASASSIPLHPGESCHFMSRFLVTWKLFEDGSDKRFLDINDVNQNSEGNGGHLCPLCMTDQERTIEIRHMIDEDWLYLAKVSQPKTLDDCDAHASLIKLEENASKVEWSPYMQISARRALEALKSIPASARRGLPVLVSSQGFLLSVPSICFKSCPCLSIDAIFMPRVPLGGGYSSYI